ncbi:MAG: hypothetical protein GWO24_30395 [Akkermansiaceae bacterium]|nr:hypothetical protein [Akkermansiaceae bacterium]
MLANGGFVDNLAGWTVANVLHVDAREFGFLTSGAAELDSSAADAWLTQEITVPGSGIRRARMVVRAWCASAVGLELTVQDDAGGTIHHDGEHTLEAVDTWCSLVADFTVTGGELVDVTIHLEFDNYQEQVYVDDVQLFMVDPQEASAEGLALELMRRRGDPGNFKHSRERYYQAVNDAIAGAPRRMWKLAVDAFGSSTVTADGDPVRRYSLAGVTGLDEGSQVRRVWMEGSDDQGYQIGRWEVEDDEGTLTLVLDDDPAEAGRDLTVEFLLAHDVLDTLDFDDTTELDREWVLRQAMVGLLMEAVAAGADLADPGGSAAVERELQRWDQLRQAREVEVLGRKRRKAGKVRSLRW